MTDYSNSTIHVVPAKKTVSVDFVWLRCLDDVPIADTLIELLWMPHTNGKMPGRIREHVPSGTDSRGFDDFTCFAPFLAAWEKAKVVYDMQVDEHNRDSAQKAAAAQEAKPYEVAVGALGETDHEIIKAMETFLGNQGKLDEGLLEKRRAWRATAKAEKQKGTVQ